MVPHCSSCLGRGPSPRYGIDNRGDTIPLPFKPCLECGLDWPVESPSTPSLSLSVVQAVEPLYGVLEPVRPADIESPVVLAS